MLPSSPVKKADPTFGTTDEAGILVIGVGNEFRGDDALGLLTVRLLHEHPLPGVRYVEQTGDGASLIEAWRECRAAIVVDAFSSGSAPGLVHVLDASITQIPQHMFASSSHAFGVSQAIELSRRLNLLPRTTIVCGIEGASFATGGSLSLSIRKHLPELLETIEHALHELVVKRNAGHVPGSP